MSESIDRQETTTPVATKVVCPANSRHEGDIIGCGSANVSEPDEEGMCDCYDCGLFFNPKTAN